MNRSIASKIILPMAGIVLVTALAVSWGFSRIEGARIRRDAQQDVRDAQANLIDTLALTHDQLTARMDAEMKVLQAEARRLGSGAQGPVIQAGVREVPDILFGRTSQADLLDRVEPITVMADAATSIYSWQGRDFVRIASHGMRLDGANGIGSILDPEGLPYRALSKGRTYWGPAQLSGMAHFTYYEPIRDAGGAMIGLFGIEFPLAQLSRVYLAVHRAQILKHGFLALVDLQGHPLFPASPVPEQGIEELARTSTLHGEPWEVQQQPFAPWGLKVLATYPLADTHQAEWTIRLAGLGLAVLLVGALTLSHFFVVRRNLITPLGDVLGVLGMIGTYKRYELRFRPQEEGEIGTLTRALNEMLDQLQDRDSQLLGYQEHLEELVAQRLNQLTQATQLLSATLDALPVYIGILDGQGAMLMTNRLWNQAIGSTNPLLSGASVGRDYRALCSAMDPGKAELKDVADQIAQVVHGQREQVHLDYDLEMDGRHQWFTLLVTRFTIQDTPRIVMLHLNLTEQRMMEMQLRQAQKLESIGQLAAGIAHEINTPTQYIGDNTNFLHDAFRDLWALLRPLQALLEGCRREGTCPPELVGAAEQALDRADLGFLESEIPRAFEQSQDGIRRVARIVSAMKDFSHPGTTIKTPTDLNRAIESTTLVCRSEWKYVADLELALDPELPDVPCLPDEFNQVILNLVINAAHAIAEALPATGAQKGLIRIATRAADGFAEIAVTDSGTGIPEAIRSRIFDPFFTTKAVGKGTGQGLAIAYAVIVEQHGGTIDLASEMGKGTMFILRLPLEPPYKKPGGGYAENRNQERL